MTAPTGGDDVALRVGPLTLTRSEVSTAARGVGRDGDDLAGVAAGIWSTLAEPGDAVAGLLRQTLGPVESLAVLASSAATIRERLHEVVGESSAGLLPVTTLDSGLGRWLPRLTPERLRASFRGASVVGATLVTSDDPAWPRGLDDLGAHAPAALWVRGVADAITASPGVALVGSRASSGYGDRVTRELADGLATRGVSVFSGGAYGVDGAAHGAALAAGGITVAFLAGGVDRFYPAGHTDLLNRVLENGAVAAEVPCGTSPSRWRFLQRNRLLAAATAATVVVEAGFRSGALNTAGHAVALGRPLGAVPGPITSPSSDGCHRLLAGPDARLITSVADIVELVGPEIGSPSGDPASAAGATLPTRRSLRAADRPAPLEVRVLDTLSPRRGRSESEVALSSGMSERDVRATLAALELSGRARELDRGWVITV